MEGSVASPPGEVLNTTSATSRRFERKTGKELVTIQAKVLNSTQMAENALLEDWDKRSRPYILGFRSGHTRDLATALRAADPANVRSRIYGYFYPVPDEDLTAAVIRDLGFTLVIMQMTSNKAYSV